MTCSTANRTPGPVSMFNISSGTQIGKLKFMRQLGLSIHEIAAYAIGRRWVRGIEEQVPNSLAHLIPQKTRRVTAGAYLYKKSWSHDAQYCAYDIVKNSRHLLGWTNDREFFQ